MKTLCKLILFCCCCTAIAESAWAWHPSVKSVCKQNSDGKYRVVFKWNPDSNEWTIPAGSNGSTLGCLKNGKTYNQSGGPSSSDCKNYFSPGSVDIGQPTFFPKVTVNSFFTTTFSGSSLSWRVGPSTAKAYSTQESCGDPTPTPTPSSTPTPCPPTPTPTPSPTPTPPVCPGEQVKDQCGKCGGDNSSCKDCAGVINGPSVIDQCGACNPPDSPLYNKTCLGCDGVPNSKKLVDECGICGGDNSSCKGCDGVPNSGKVVDACGVCDGQNAVCIIGCDGVANSGKVVDECGVCGGDGSSCHCPLKKVKIDKSELIKKAKVIFSDKTVKYYNGMVKCNGSLKKLSKRQIQKALKVLEEYIMIVRTIPTEVEVCPGECVDVVLKKTIEKLRRLNKKLYSYASDAQHGARAACKNTGPGKADTKKLSDSLDKDLKNCHENGKVCA